MDTNPTLMCFLQLLNKYPTVEKNLNNLFLGTLIGIMLNL